MTKRPAFWIAFAVLALFAAGFAILNFPKAFPIVSLDLRMDRAAALRSAHTLAAQNHWGPAGAFRQVASFGVDDTVKTFVELKGGGKEAFRDMLRRGLYAAYTWRVRHFEPGEANETLVRFTPDGRPYGFRERVRETAPGPALGEPQARRIAEEAATQRWHVDLALYSRVETSKEVRPNGRADHTFVYERNAERAGEGRYRLRLVVSGDRLTELTHFLRVPEAFARQYEEMRSANDGIAFGAQAVAIVLYLVGGGMVGVFLMLRRRWLLWRPAVAIGLVIAFVQALADLNAWPLIWVGYDTALPVNTFVLQRLFAIVGSFVITAGYLSLSFMAAESLSRKAFPHHPQQWKLWSRDAVGSVQILGRTAGGYLYTGLQFGFIVGFYLLVSRLLHWWTPSEALVDPDVLASYAPWLSALAPSAQAGIWEESLFRAVPIAAAALIGDRYGHRRAWIVGALVLQALVFGSAHANYASWPAYARPVELILPSLVWGIIYLNFGLLPTALAHFLFDVILFSLPLFTSTSPATRIDQVLIVLWMLAPLGIVLLARARAGRWSELAAPLRNAAWTPPAAAPAEPALVSELPVAGALAPGRTRLFLALGALGLAAWVATLFVAPDTRPFRIGRAAAEARSLEALAARGFKPPATWRVLASIDDRPDLQDAFVWRTAGPKTYATLLGRYLDGPRWTVRVATFEGDVAERAEEWVVSLKGDGEVTRIEHKLPQGRPGAALEEPQARAIARDAVRATFQLDLATLKEVSAVSNKLPARRDWTFTFADSAAHALTQGELRLAVTIAGDQVVDAHRLVHVPEAWERDYRSTQGTLGLLRAPRVTFAVVLIITGLVIAIIAWSRGAYPARFAFLAFAALGAVLLATTFNNWPALEARFSTAQPLQLQRMILVVAALLTVSLFAAALALVLGLVHGRLSGGSAAGPPAPVALGIALGALAMGVQALQAFIGRAGSPVWLNDSPAQAFVPFLGEAFSPVITFLNATATQCMAFLLAHQLTGGWTRQRALIGSALFLVGMGLLQSGSAASPAIWLAQSAIGGVFLVALYTLVLRFDLSLVPVLLATVAVLTAIRAGLSQAHAAALAGSLAGAALVAAIAAWWRAALRRTSP